MSAVYKVLEQKPFRKNIKTIAFVKQKSRFGRLFV